MMPPKFQSLDRIWANLKTENLDQFFNRDRSHYQSAGLHEAAPFDGLVIPSGPIAREHQAVEAKMPYTLLLSCFGIDEHFAFFPSQKLMLEKERLALIVIDRSAPRFHFDV
jgi:hypothetical protein